MLYAYFPILIAILLSIAFGIFALFIGRLLSPSRPYSAKLNTYECGFESFGTARLPFNIKYARIAILFIIFDIETAFLFPWAVSLRQVGLPALLGVLFFIAILSIGFIYEWKQGALEWT